MKKEKKIRFSYGEVGITPEAALKLTHDFALAMGELYNDEELCKAGRSVLAKQDPGTSPPSCCEVEEATKVISKLLVRDMLSWATIGGSITGQAAQALRDCATWRIQMLARALMDLQETTLRMQHLGKGEKPPFGHRVVEIVAT